MIEARPDWVVWPDNAGQVAAILKLATRYHVPVVPRGAGSGLTGGSLPVRGGIVLSLSRMDRIISLEPENMLAEVEPGVINADLDRAAARYGLFYPPDPASFEFSTLGGNVAESAGGLRAVKYGVTRDYVLGLEAVLPNGDLIRTGSRTAKCVVGYDLTRLLVGSEGTLAVFTKLILRLVSRPEAVKTILAIFPDVHAAAQVVSALNSRTILPTTLEFMDRSSIDCVKKFAHITVDEKAGALLLIEIDGPHETIERQAQNLIELCRQHTSLEIILSHSDEERDALWKARRAISPALHQIAPDKFNEDVVVPRSKIPDLVSRLEAISQTHNLTIVSFGHAGDGNIHVNILTDLAQPGTRERVDAALHELFRHTIELGGTISGEHGIGLTKAPFLSMELDPVTLAIMKKIKRVFDPLDILNPGKIFNDNHHD
ncbi:FAD-binding protein [bacterium]|nr:FAD-binding protein [bacterium]